MTHQAGINEALQRRHTAVLSSPSPSNYASFPGSSDDEFFSVSSGRSLSLPTASPLSVIENRSLQSPAREYDCDLSQKSIPSTPVRHPAMISRAPRHQRLSISPISMVFTSPVNMVTDQTSPLAGYIGKRASKPSQRSEEAREIIETASEEKSGSIQEPPEENVETPLAGPKPTDACQTPPPSSQIHSAETTTQADALVRASIFQGLGHSTTAAKRSQSLLSSFDTISPKMCCVKKICHPQNTLERYIKPPYHLSNHQPVPRAQALAPGKECFPTRPKTVLDEVTPSETQDVSSNYRPHEKDIEEEKENRGTQAVKKQQETDATLARTIGVRRLRIKSTPRRRLLVKMEADVNLDMSADGKITQASLDEQDEQDDVTYDSGHECSDSGWSSAESGQGDDVESLPQLGAPLGVNEEFPCVGCDAFRPGAPLPRKQPYILHSAYGHSVKFPEFDPTGRTGRYIPHHRDTIVGLKGILKPSTMRFKESEVSDDAESDAQPDLPVHYAGSTTDGNGSHASTQIKPEIMGRLESSPVLRGPRGSDKTVQHPFYDKATSPIHKSPAPARSIEVARAEALKRVHDPPPSYIMSKAMKPTIDRLKKRIEDGTEPSEQIRHVHLAASPGAKAVEAELEYRGLRTSVQKDMLFSELAREYSRLLAGSSECLLSMWRKMMGDLYDECLEIRRDLTTQPKPTVKPLTPLEALVAYGQGCTDESSVCTSDDESDTEEEHRHESTVIPDEKDRKANSGTTTGLMTPASSPAGSACLSVSNTEEAEGKVSAEQMAPGRASSPLKRRLSGDGGEQEHADDRGRGEGACLMRKRQLRRVDAVSHIVQRTLRLGSSAERAVAVKTDKALTDRVREIINFHAGGGWKKRVLGKRRRDTRERGRDDREDEDEDEEAEREEEETTMKKAAKMLAARKKNKRRRRGRREWRAVVGELMLG